MSWYKVASARHGSVCLPGYKVVCACHGSGVELPECGDVVTVGHRHHTVDLGRAAQLVPGRVVSWVRVNLEHRDHSNCENTKLNHAHEAYAGIIYHKGLPCKSGHVTRKEFFLKT